ncbi:putative ribonuclease H-like domain-containing protein [Tanacetum coccineum]
MTHPYPKRSFVPQAVLTRSGKLSTTGATVKTTRPINTANTKAVNTIRPVNTVTSKPIMNHPRPKTNAFKRGYSQTSRSFNRYYANKNSIINTNVNTARIKYTTARDKAVETSAILMNMKTMMVDLFPLVMNNVLLTDTECLVLSSDFKLLDESQVLLRVPRKDNIYSVDLKSVVPTRGLTCLIAKAIIDESNTWHRRLGNINFKTMNKLVKGNLVEGLPSKIFENDHSCVACQKRKQHKASYKTKLGIEREFNVARTPQQNSVAERKNRTLIEAVKTMLVDSNLPTTFWAEAVNTACYVINKVLVIKPHNKTLYKLIREIPPLIDFMKPFGCPVTILNTRDHLGKFDGKADKGYFVGYFVVSKAMRVFYTRTRIVKETLNIRFRENTPSVKGNGPDWIFDVDSLTISMNYVPVAAWNKTNGIAGTKDSIVAGQAQTKKELEKEYILIPLCTPDLLISQGPEDCEGYAGMKPTEYAGSSFDTVVPSTPVSTAGPSFYTAVPSTPVNTAGPSVNNTSIFRNAYDDEYVEEEVDMNNVISSYTAPDTSFTKFHKDHPEDQVFRNNKDKRGIVVKNKARLVAQGHTQEKGIYYDEVFAPVARIKAIRLFLAYGSFKDFVVCQMDVNSAFLYGKIKKEVYVCQALGFEDLHFTDKVYKVEKALYGLHQAPKAWYETLSTNLLENGFHKGQIDKTLFIKRHKDDILLLQVYVDDIIFRSTKKQMSNEFETLMHDNQDKYVVEILKKFDFSSVKTASTPMEINKTLIKDEEAEDVDVYFYRSMIGLLMYLTASRRDIIFAVCACASDYAGASLDRKSTTGGCQFLSKRLISWQCKKHTIVANSTTKAKYVAAANCYGQVGNKAVYKELGDRMERAATTASSLEAEQDSGSGPRCQDTILGDANAQTRFKTTSKQSNDPPLSKVNTFGSGEESMQLMELMTHCTKLSALDSAKLRTVNRDVQIQALIGWKKIIVNEASIRRDLKLEDAEGSPCLPNATIFEELTRMSAKTTTWNEFNSTMASAITCLANNQKFNFSKYIFDSMVQASEEVGEDSDHPTDSNQIPIVLDLEKAKSDQAIEIASLKKRVIKLERRRKFRTIRLQRLKKGRRIKDLDANAEVTSINQTQERHDEDLMFDTRVLDGDEMFVDVTTGEKEEQSTKIDEVTTAGVEDGDAPIILVSGATTVEKTLAQTLMEIKAAKPKSITTAAKTTPKAKGIIFYDQEEQVSISKPTVSVTQPSIKDKGKGIMQDPKRPLIKKHQIAIDEDLARNIQAQLDVEIIEEDMLERKKQEEANITLIESWENTQAIMEANRLLAERLQTKEREELTDEEKGKLFMELKEKRRKHFAALRAQEKRNRPPTKAQNRSQMSTYIKHMGGYKHKQLKGKSYDEIQKLFDKEMKRVNTFVAISLEVQESNEKKGEKETDKHEEVEADELKKHLVIVKDDDISIDAIQLATKPPVIVDYKLLKEGIMAHYLLIRADGTTTPLIEFSGEIIWPIGQIQLLVKIGDEEHFASAWMNFVVVRSPSSYNKIIGRPGVIKLQAVLSIAHGMLKLPVEGGVITLKRSSLVQMECALVSRTEETLSTTKPTVEERVKKPADITGIPRHIAEHHLNVRDGCSPVRQKKRGQKADRNQAIQEEVKKLMKAGIIKRRDVLRIQSQHQKAESMSRHGGRCLKYSITKMLERRTKVKQKARKPEQQLIAELPMLTAPMKKEELILYLATTKETGIKRPRVSVKGQILVAFIVERLEEDSPDTLMEVEEELPEPWILFTDGSSCTDGSGAGLILINPKGIEFTYALIFRFLSTNNEAEYEALIARLRIVEQMGVKNLQANVDSQLVDNQVNGTYIAKEVDMIRYLEKVRTLTSSFKTFSIRQVHRSENKKADALRKIASTSFVHLSKQVLVEELKEKSISKVEIPAVVQEEEDTWMTPIFEYLTQETLPANMKKAKRPLQANYVLRETYEGSYSMHADTRSVMAKALRIGYYWPTMHKDARTLIRSCQDCQVYKHVPRNPQQKLTPITSPWSFYKWGIDIAGPFLEGPGKVKILIMAMDYFIKWIEAKPLTTITGNQIKNFLWDNIVCRFGLPGKIISNNGKQFWDNPFKDWCKKLCIHQHFASVKHSQTNGLIEELSHVLWAHCTMIKSSNGDTPFSITYETEAVIPAEIGMLTLRTAEVDLVQNNEALEINLNLLEERREQAAIHEAKSKARM